LQQETTLAIMPWSIFQGKPGILVIRQHNAAVQYIFDHPDDEVYCNQPSMLLKMKSLYSLKPKVFGDKVFGVNNYDDGDNLHNPFRSIKTKIKSHLDGEGNPLPNAAVPTLIASGNVDVAAPSTPSTSYVTRRELQSNIDGIGEQILASARQERESRREEREVRDAELAAFREERDAELAAHREEREAELASHREEREAELAAQREQREADREARLGIESQVLATSMAVQDMTTTVRRNANDIAENRGRINGLEEVATVLKFEVSETKSDLKNLSLEVGTLKGMARMVRKWCRMFSFGSRLLSLNSIPHTCIVACFFLSYRLSPLCIAIHCLAVHIRGADRITHLRYLHEFACECNRICAGLLFVGCICV
jgi:hypothetical protein